MIIVRKHYFFAIIKDDIGISRQFIHAVSLVCRNSVEGTRQLVLRMAVGTGPLITGRLRLLINRNVLSEIQEFNNYKAKSSA
jgi:hypothetical protein